MFSVVETETAWFGRTVFEKLWDGKHKGFDVWWSDSHGPCCPIVAALGGPLGNRNDPVPDNQAEKLLNDVIRRRSV